MLRIIEINQTCWIRCTLDHNRRLLLPNLWCQPPIREDDKWWCRLCCCCCACLRLFIINRLINGLWYSCDLLFLNATISLSQTNPPKTGICFNANKRLTFVYDDFLFQARSVRTSREVNQISTISESNKDVIWCWLASLFLWRYCIYVVLWLLGTSSSTSATTGYSMVNASRLLL